MPPFLQTFFPAVFAQTAAPHVDSPYCKAQTGHGLGGVGGGGGGGWGFGGSWAWAGPGRSQGRPNPRNHRPPPTLPPPPLQYDSPTLQLFTSSLFIAGLVASLVASGVTRAYGRRATMLAAGACFLAGAGLTAGAVHVAMLVVGRVALGVGVGFANQASFCSFITCD